MREHLVLHAGGGGGGGGGGIFEKRYDAHPQSWLVVSAGQQKSSEKLGEFFVGKSLDFGSTSGRGCFISNYMYAYQLVYSWHVLACTNFTLSLTQRQLATVFGHGHLIS